MSTVNRTPAGLRPALYPSADQRDWTAARSETLPSISASTHAPRCRSAIWSHHYLRKLPSGHRPIVLSAASPPRSASLRQGRGAQLLSDANRREHRRIDLFTKFLSSAMAERALMGNNADCLDQLIQISADYWPHFASTASDLRLVKLMLERGSANFIEFNYMCAGLRTSSSFTVRMAAACSSRVGQWGNIVSGIELGPAPTGPTFRLTSPYSTFRRRLARRRGRVWLHPTWCRLTTLQIGETARMPRRRF